MFRYISLYFVFHAASVSHIYRQVYGKWEKVTQPTVKIVPRTLISSSDLLSVLGGQHLPFIVTLRVSKFPEH